MRLHDHYTAGMRDEIQEINQRTVYIQRQAEHDHNVLLETHALANTIDEQAYRFYQYYGYYPQ